ncbi:hypothetical protein ACM41_29240 [Bradyrhizobium sp. CCBAU 21362]|nr:hypothetical protein [Bradyrhizobium sp. CCBAU 21362]
MTARRREVDFLKCFKSLRRLAWREDLMWRSTHRCEVRARRSLDIASALDMVAARLDAVKVVVRMSEK